MACGFNSDAAPASWLGIRGAPHAMHAAQIIATGASDERYPANIQISVRPSGTASKTRQHLDLDLSAAF